MPLAATFSSRRAGRRRVYRSSGKLSRPRWLLWTVTLWAIIMGFFVMDFFVCPWTAVFTH
jgi:hypothetical protein